MNKIKNLSEGAFLKLVFAFLSVCFLVAAVCMPDRNTMFTGLWQIMSQPNKISANYFYMGGFGLAPSSAYWGVICTAEDAPIGWGGLDVEYMWDGEGWYWQEENSDNHSYVTKLDDHWYLYQMWF